MRLNLFYDSCILDIKSNYFLQNSRAPLESLSDDNQSLDCKRIEQEAAKTQALLQECRSSRKKLGDEIKSLVKARKALDIRLPKLSLEISGFDTSRTDLETFIPQLRSQCELSEDDEVELIELNKEVQQCKSVMSSCAILASKLESDVARLQKAILDAGGSEMKKQQSTCEKALLALNDAEKTLASSRVAITTNVKAAEKARKASKTAAMELEGCGLVLVEKETALAALAKDALAVKQSFDNVHTIEEEKRAALEEASKECDEKKKLQADLRCKEIDLLGQIDALDKQINDCDKRQIKWGSELKKLRSAVDEEDVEFDNHEDEGDDMDRKDSDRASLGNEDTDMPNADESSPESKNEKSSSSLPTLSFAVLDKYDINEISHEISILESERSAIAKNANMGAIAEYRKKEVDYLARVEELDNVTEQRNDARRKHDDLRRQRLEMFMEGFGQITLRLKEMYQMITLGGDAELELVDSLDPFSEGIVFSVRPPKKSWKNISNLSGGEKTLSSLALVFALHHFKPTPLYVMDEIDAALDFKNVSIVANYIKERTRNAQFIIISLRNNMFELADRLVGIYKTNNCTKSVTIDPRAFGTKGQANGFVPGTPILSNRINNTNEAKSASSKMIIESAVKDSRGKAGFLQDSNLKIT
jgi:structural maintenance of chromosome 4